MEAVIVAAGELDTSFQTYLNAAKLIIAADGGGDYLLKLGIVPKVVIGDFDSISPEAVAKFKTSGSKLIQVEREKDETDTELAVQYALRCGVRDIVILGALGGRLDHTLANLILLARLAKDGIRARAATPSLTVHAVTGQLVISGNAGELVSVFPFQGPAKGVTETGFKYSLKDADLDPFAVVGISNELAGPQGVIQVKKGVLLVFHYHSCR
ncbi:MAG: thiamine diphosphokinase [Firmicutes bacterium]|nr:thiamine diphosphokinase [Bacillota bacterium]